MFQESRVSLDPLKHSHFFKTLHAIGLEHACLRPYVRWEKGDIQRCLDEYDKYLRLRFVHGPRTEDEKLARKEKNHIRNIARQSGGWIIWRHSYGGVEWSSVSDGELTYPYNPSVSQEFRPDEAITTSPPHWHFHPSGAPTRPWRATSSAQLSIGVYTMKVFGPSIPSPKRRPAASAARGCRSRFTAGAVIRVNGSTVTAALRER